jgi:hypothetical protein
MHLCAGFPAVPLKLKGPMRIVPPPDDEVAIQENRLNPSEAE